MEAARLIFFVQTLGIRRHSSRFMAEKTFTFVCGSDDFLVGRLGKERYAALSASRLRWMTSGSSSFPNQRSLSWRLRVRLCLHCFAGKAGWRSGVKLARNRVVTFNHIEICPAFAGS